MPLSKLLIDRWTREVERQAGRQAGKKSRTEDGERGRFHHDGSGGIKVAVREM